MEWKVLGDMEEKKPQEVKLEIQLDEEMAQGAYVNLAVVNHNDSEFVVDLIFVQPQAPRAKVRSRVILSPSTPSVLSLLCRRILTATNRTLAKLHRLSNLLMMWDIITRLS